MMSLYLPQNVNVSKLFRRGQLDEHSRQVNSQQFPVAIVNKPPSNTLWKLIKCCQPTGPCNSVSYCSLALLPSVPPSACTLDRCCSDVSWPGGSFHVYCAKKERRRSGERGWDGKWLRFSLISAPIHCKASGRNCHCRRQTAYAYQWYTNNINNSAENTYKHKCRGTFLIFI